MTTDQDKSDAHTLCPVSCCDRTETFARHLQSRLNSLGTSNSEDNENARPMKLLIAQPQDSTDSVDEFYDLNSSQSPSSPDEIKNFEIKGLINTNDNLNGTECSRPDETNRAASNDSDSSDGPYYDLDEQDKLNTDNEKCNNHCNGYAREEKNNLNRTDDEHVTSELPPQNDFDIYCSKLNVEKDFTVECPNITNGSEVNLLNVLNNEAILTQEEKLAIEDLEEEEPIPRIRRCSSLKTGKTPPGTPGRKKIVRFADVLGLDLADVRTFLDEIPKVPNSAYEDLRDADLHDEENSFMPGVGHSTSLIGQKILIPLFQQPGGQPDFLERVRENYVCLENALVGDTVSLSITGTVRVRNLDFHKSVHVRYTLDRWKHYADVQATYVQNSCDGFSDKFKFIIYAHTLAVGQQLEFAVRFSCKGALYWDSNNGLNYRFECLPGTNNPTFAPIVANNEHDWGATFYYGEDGSGDDKEITNDSDLIQTAVQEYVTNSLGNINNRNKGDNFVQKKTDVITLFAVLIFSLLFMFIQKAIYFTK